LRFLHKREVDCKLMWNLASLHYKVYIDVVSSAPSSTGKLHYQKTRHIDLCWTSLCGKLSIHTESRFFLWKIM